jgi:hypothetical protein
MTDAEREAWNAGIVELTNESGGFVDVEFITTDRIIELAAAGSSGLLTMVEQFVCRAQREKPLCLTCEARPSIPEVAALVLVHTGKPGLALCSAICCRCAEAGGDEVQRRSFDALRQVWPDLKQFAGGTH